jgi:hypothetical protein
MIGYHQIRKFNFQSLFSKDDYNNLRDDIRSEIANGNVADESLPKWQTNPNLFNRKEDYWNKLRESFIAATNIYTGNPPPIKDAFGWAVMSNDISHETHWFHQHHTTDVSGIFYLSNFSGTQFTIDKQCSTMVLDPVIGWWYIFPSMLSHRPYDYQGEEMRFTIAADIRYERILS